MKDLNPKAPLYHLVEWFFQKTHLDPLFVLTVLSIVILAKFLKDRGEYMKGSWTTKFNWHMVVGVSCLSCLLCIWFWLTRWGLIK